jgi:2-C-methyl-D-erythritol 4-phosphate cytidylyltransferase
MTSVSALIPFAGSGERLGLGPKALLELGGEPIVARLVRKCARLDGEVLVAVPAEMVGHMRSLCAGAKVIAGGATRQDTIGLLLAQSRSDLVLIQDGARPFASLHLMQAVIEGARESGAAGAFLAAEVPVARIAEGWVTDEFAAKDVALFQAPQAFHRELLVEVYTAAARHGWQTQSTVQLAMRAGKRVRAVPGEKTNIKITSEDDWQHAQMLLDHL